MAFVDRVVEYPSRFTLTDTNNNVTGPYTLTRDEGTVSVAGTLLNASNLNTQTQLDSAVVSALNTAGMTSGTYQNDMSDAINFLLAGVDVQTSGSWYYIRLGTVTVAWAKLTFTIANTIASSGYGGYRSAESMATIPSGIFGATPTVAYAMKNTSNGLHVMNVDPYSSTTLKFFTGGSESVTIAGINISFLAIGASA